MSSATTTYRIVHPTTRETIYRTSDAATARRERKSGHVVMAVSRGGER